MKNSYPVIFTKTEQEILVEVPDFEILTQGTNVSDAIEMARDAIVLKGITLENENLPIPEPSDMENISLHNSTFTENGKTFLSFVDVNF